MYAGCVLWPLHLDAAVGAVIGCAIVVLAAIQYIVGLIKRQTKKEAAT